MHRRLQLLTLSSVLAAACGAPAEVRYETEHLRIAPTFDAPLCAGELERYERHIAHAEELLGTTMDEPVTVYLWLAEDFPYGEYCADSAVGCYNDRHREIWSTLLALEHELIHPIEHRMGDPADLFSEGACEMLSGDRTLQFGASPAENIDRDGTALDYAAAGHFSRWLWETHGRDKYIDLLHSKSKGRSAFEAIYGLSIEAASELYLAEAPYAYAPFHACEYPVLPAVDAEHWSERMLIDCDDPETYGGTYAIGVPRILEVAVRGDYAISTDAEGFSISLCPDAHLQVMPQEGDPAFGDIPPVTDAFRARYARAFWGSEEQVLDLVPGRYEVAVIQKELTIREVGLAVELRAVAQP